MVRPISQTLFDLLAIGTRRSITRITTRESSWWSTLDGDILGTVFLDTYDQDWNWILLARDRIGRFRCADIRVSYPTERVAMAQLRVAMAEKSRDPAFTGMEEQGDEPERVLDLFEDRGVDDARLHPYFLELRDRPGRSPARKVFEAISPWLVSSDPHLVKEFQESQFDQRLWEIYLWAMFRDQGYDVEHSEAPDLIVASPWFNFSVEATTVAPSTSGALALHPNPETPEEVAAFLTDYMPMKFGSPLVSKLRKVDAQGKHYWEKPGAEGLPFVLAVADFHKAADGQSPASLTYSQGGLYPYLYGTRVSAEVVDGHLIFRNEPVTEHTYNGKTVPSGFFDLPDAEHVSAVVFSNAGTLAKFDRMGVLAGFAPPKHIYRRIGYMFDPDPEALVGIPFSIDVTDPNYREFWGDEVQVFHNPRALTPIPVGAFPDAAHFFYKQGKLMTRERDGRVLSSMTLILQIVPDEQFKAMSH
jgi:hypothetical protein